MGFWSNLKEIFLGKNEPHTDAYDERFYAWAFGTKHHLSNEAKVKCWNGIHGDKMILIQDENMLSRLDEMQDHFDKYLAEIEKSEKILGEKLGQKLGVK